MRCFRRNWQSSILRFRRCTHYSSKPFLLGMKVHFEFSLRQWSTDGMARYLELTEQQYGIDSVQNGVLLNSPEDASVSDIQLEVRITSPSNLALQMGHSASLSTSTRLNIHCSPRLSGLDGKAESINDTLKLLVFIMWASSMARRSFRRVAQSLPAITSSSVVPLVLYYIWRWISRGFRADFHYNIV